MPIRKPKRAAAAFLVSAGLMNTASADECNDTVYQRGIASVYHNSLEGNLTANGEVFDQSALTAAHNTLRFGTRVEVTDLERDESVVVTINDRGPFVDGRIIDLSDAARRALGDNNSRPGLHNVALRLCPSN